MLTEIANWYFLREMFNSIPLKARRNYIYKNIKLCEMSAVFRVGTQWCVSRSSIRSPVSHGTMHFDKLCGQLCGPRLHRHRRCAAIKLIYYRRSQYGYAAITAAQSFLVSFHPKSSLYNRTSLIDLTAAMGTFILDLPWHRG